MSTATERRATTGISNGKGSGYSIKTLASTVEIATATAAGEIALFGYIPSNARIMGASTVYWDDLGTSAATLDIGLFAVDSNITSDDDALNDGLALLTASTGVAVIKDMADYGKEAWEFVAGQTVDPGGTFAVKGSIKDADVATGTITQELYYTFD